MNKKKIFQAVLVILLLAFSFYYTDKSIELIREIDPIMKQIKLTTDKYTIKPVDAKIVGNKITPGKSGKQIDYDESYSKMKQYGNYNEALTTFKELQPTVSINDYYDKFVVGGNSENKSAALVFELKDQNNPNNIISTLKDKGTKATFFIDGLYLENNLNLVKEMTPYELEILSYNNRYEEVYFRSSLNYLSSITNKNPKYCYATYDQKEIIELCSKLKLHTIVPTILAKNYPYKDIKEKLTNASIISLPINSSTEIELPTIIDYLKQRGFSLLTLDELLSENFEK